MIRWMWKDQDVSVWLDWCAYYSIFTIIYRKAGIIYTQDLQLVSEGVKSVIFFLYYQSKSQLHQTIRSVSLNSTGFSERDLERFVQNSKVDWKYQSCYCLTFNQWWTGELKHSYSSLSSHQHFLTYRRLKPHIHYFLKVVTFSLLSSSTQHGR